MRRLPSLPRLLALLTAALLLWLAPRFAGSTPTSTVPAASPSSTVRSPDFATKASVGHRPAHAAAPATPGSVFKLSDGGATRNYAVALDELYFPGRPVARRLEAIPPQADLPTLLAHAADLGAGASQSEAPRLVLYPVGATRDARTRRIVNPRVEVRLASADTPSPAPRPDLGIVSWERPAYAPDHALARIVGDAAQPLRAALAATALPGVRSARPLLARQRFARAKLNDPMIGKQWHLGGIRATPAWDSATGAGVVIGIIDDGVDLSHPDLAPALDGDLGYDWNGNDTNPSAEDHELDYDGYTYFLTDDHGTAVSGLAAARGDNGIGGAGSAPAATLAALRLIAGPVDDSEEAAAMTWRNDAISVKNNSWGPYDYYPDLNPAPPLWLSSIASGVTHGRNGLGVLYFWAAGNGQSSGDQGSLDGYASARPVIAVGATSRSGGIAGFSEGGPHLVVSAPGAAGIVTSDRVGLPGYTKGSYTQSFNGTSAATPIAAGVGALLLQARPDLGWRDVKEIFLRSSTKLMGSSGDWVTRTAGDTAFPIKHHPRLGGGQVNALQALTLARTWVPLGPETQVTAYPSSAGSMLIPDNPRLPLTLTFEPPVDDTVLRVEHVVLTLNISHTYRGDLEISLASPAGTVSRFAKSTRRMAGGDPDDPTLGADYDDYPFTSVRHWGETSRLPAFPSRRWTLTIRDNQASDYGYLNSASLTFYGTPLAAPALVAAPDDQALATGSTLVLRAAFSGGNLDYVWRRNGQIIPGADGAEHRVADFSAKHAGVYTCTATNALGGASCEIEASVDDSPRDTFSPRAGTSTSIDLGEYVDGDVALWKSGALPPGLRLDPLTGILSGRPTKPGSYSVVVTATKRDKALVRVPLAFSIAPVSPALTGNYVALVSRHAAFNGDLGGALSLTVNANAAVSGRLVLGKTEYPFTGLLDGTDEAPTLAVAFAKPGLRLALTLAEIEGLASLAGRVETLAADSGTSAASVSGARSAWKASTRPATAYVGASAAAFFPAGGELGLGATVMTVQVAADGRATWLITPADGSPALTGSTPLTDHGLLLSHAPYSNLLGSFRAAVLAPSSESPAIAAPSSIDWLRKSSASLAQPGGFGPVDLAPAAGSARHVKPAPGVRILGLGDASNEVDFKLAPHAAAIGSASRLDAAIGVSAANAFTIAAPNTRKLVLTFAADSGRITGSYLVTTPASRTARVTAVVLPASNPPLALGFAFTPATNGAPPASELVVIGPASD